jgi:5-methyltetrahydropteroyltriglutamate--homocysteine methyltransferase
VEAVSSLRSQIQSLAQASPLRRLLECGALVPGFVSIVRFEIMSLMPPSPWPVDRVLPTTVVGSYPQPDWLIDRGALGSRLPPRTRARDIWRVAPEFLEQAQDDGTVLAIREMERAGIDIITDGEIRRESYSNRFATALDGIDLERPGTALDRTGHPNPVPRVVGPIRRLRPVLVRDVEFLRANTMRTIKATLPGPFTMTQQAQDDYYGDEEALAMGLAEAVNEEVRDLFAAGADVVQIDEPYLQARAEKARRFAIRAINRALLGADGTTALHTCFGYAHIVHDRPSGYPFFEELADAAVDQISLESAQQSVDLSILRAVPKKRFLVGVIDLADDSPVEDVEVVASRIRNALRFVGPERLVLAPDCGMKYLPRWKAFQKLTVLATAAAWVRVELI